MMNHPNGAPSMEMGSGSVGSTRGADDPMTRTISGRRANLFPLLRGRAFHDNAVQIGVAQASNKSIARTHISIQPLSTVRLTPFTPLFASRKSTAPMTSSIVTNRPPGVRCLTISIACIFSAQKGLSPTMPG